MKNELTPLQALERLRPKTTYEPYYTRNERRYCCDIIETALKDYEMEHTLRVRLENINYELVREKQENEKKLKALEIIKKLPEEEKQIILNAVYTYASSEEEYNLLLKEIL